MNALVSVRSAPAIIQTPTPQQRAEAAQEVTSLGRANLLGKALPGSVVAKQQTSPLPNIQDPNSEDGLGRDAFLQLLLTQVSNQDPLEPLDNTEMVAQLAQFSALEQMSNVASGVETLSGNIDQLNFINASNLLGKEITGLDQEGQFIQGTVEHVQLDGSVVMLTVNDRLVSMAGVQAIRDSSPGASLNPAADIGDTDSPKQVK